MERREIPEGVKERVEGALNDLHRKYEGNYLHMEWGERVSAAVVLKEGVRLTLESLRMWARERLAVHKIPTRMLIVEDLPLNAVGKVFKPEVVRLFESMSQDT